MKGIYENRHWFRTYEDIFSVENDGIVYQGRKYNWNEVKIAGTGRWTSIDIKGMKNFPLNYRTFRKKGQRGKVSFLGVNHTLIELSAYITRKKLESEYRDNRQMEELVSKERVLEPWHIALLVALLLILILSYVLKP